jgi:hypothetical protein
MLGLVLALEVWFVCHKGDFTNTIAADWRETRRSVARESASCSILCFGDSLIKHGIVPALVERKLGGRCYNLAVSGGYPPGSYFLLRKAIRAGARPEAAIVDFDPNHLVEGIYPSARLWPELVSLSDCLELAYTARDPSLVARVGSCALLPSVRSREEIRGNIMGAFRGEISFWRFANLPFRRNWEHNQGSQLLPRRPSDPEHVQRAARVFTNAQVYDRISTLYIERFLSLAEANGIITYWLLPPYHSEVRSSHARLGALAAQSEFTAKLLARYRQLVVVDGRSTAYPASLFADPVHLAREGACRFTDDVAAAVESCRNEARAERRWLTLPPYQDQPTQTVGEDLEGSKLAIKAQFSRRF